MRIYRSIVLAVLIVSVSVAARAQSQPPRSSIHAGVGVMILHYYHENPYNQRYYGPAVTVGYDYRFAKQLSVSAGGSVGQILVSGPTSIYDPSSPGLMKARYYTGTVSNSERIRFDTAINFHPWTWLSLGIGPYCEFLKSAWIVNGNMNIRGWDEDVNDYVTTASIPILHYNDSQSFRYGIALPVMVQLYSNDTLSVRVSYQTSFFRESQGKFRMGTNTAAVSFAVYL